MTSDNDAGKPTGSHEAYLGYLEKEMNIMGILSAFCVLTVAGIANGFREVDPTRNTLSALIWNVSHEFIVVGCIFMMAAALFFYRQRSHLAWCYGQICLAQFDSQTYGSLDEWLELSDSWWSWRSYKAAFTAIGIAVTELALAVLATRYCFLLQGRVALATPMVIGVAYAVPMFCVMQVYASHRRPWRKFLQYVKFLLFHPNKLAELKNKH